MPALPRHSVSTLNTGLEVLSKMLLRPATVGLSLAILNVPPLTMSATSDWSPDSAEGAVSRAAGLAAGGGSTRRAAATRGRGGRGGGAGAGGARPRGAPAPAVSP